MAKRRSKSILPAERIQQCIFFIRGEKVMLDKDLAILYGVETRVLNQTVKRNLDRFLPDFMFQLTRKERDEVITNCDNLLDLKYSPAFPYAFTEQGVAMLSSVLRSQRAVEVNIAIMRTFVQLRKILADNSLLRNKIESLEQKYDEQFQQVFAVLEQMLIDDPEDKKQIGYHTEAEK
jgi:hypothetical protein